MKSLLLVCAVSTFTVQAVSPPLAMVAGPYHQPAFLDLFAHLESTAWKAAEMRFGERSSGGRVIIVGENDRLKWAFLDAGWVILARPYKRDQATLVLMLADLGGNEMGLQHIVQDFAVYLRPGGFFVLRSLQFPADVSRFIMGGFEPRLGGIKVEEHHYDVFQKRERRSA